MTIAPRALIPLVIGVVLAGLATWHVLTMYSPGRDAPAVDPRPRALMHAVLSRALERDSIGAVRVGASPVAAGWALVAARGDSTTVRGWSNASETQGERRRGDTISRTWFTTASLQRCTGAAALAARFVARADTLTLVELDSPCAPLAPITFSVGPDTAQQR